jgi:hypothetical protein
MPEGDFEQMREMYQSWMEMLTRMSGLCAQVKVGDPPTEAARQFRGAFFKTMSDQVEEFLRSEAFLQSIKKSLDSGLKFQKQYQDAMAGFRHATAGVAASDVDAILRTLHQLETRILDRLEDLEARVEKLSVGSNGQSRSQPASAEGRPV